MCEGVFKWTAVGHANIIPKATIQSIPALLVVICEVASVKT